LAEAITIRLQRSIPGIDLNREYTSFALNWDRIEQAAEELDIFSPMDFVSQSADQFDELMEGGEDKSGALQKFLQLLKDYPDEPGMQKLKASLEAAENPQELFREMICEEAPEEEWFEIDEGVAFLDQLLDYVRRQPNAFKKSEELRVELQEMLKVLQAAKKDGQPFYFNIEDD
jgi:hypothetical protein